MLKIFRSNVSSRAYKMSSRVDDRGRKTEEEPVKVSRVQLKCEGAAPIPFTNRISLS